MSTITDISAQEILDSRGYPTLEATVTLASSAQGRASVPSGASVGRHEALELRDQDPCRYGGRGVLKAVGHVNKEIRQALLGQKAAEQKILDELMLKLDATPNKAHLGANAILAVSLALAKAVATDRSQGLYEYLAELLGHKSLALPVPLFNILNGGMHADNNLDIQEFMIIPVGSVSFAEALRCGSEIFHSLRRLLKKRGLNVNVGDEGGFAPNLRSHGEAIELILTAIEQANYRPGTDVYLGLDIASSALYKENVYWLEDKPRSAEEWVTYLMTWVNQYPIISIEDAMAENDIQGWALLTQALGKKVQLVGDDLFVTNPDLLAQGIAANIANAILVKPNQIGSLSQTLTAINLAKAAHYATVISHRSGETEDNTIADLSVATGIGQIKAGAPCRTDRVAKYNQLWRLETSLKNKAVYSGRQAFAVLN